MSERLRPVTLFADFTCPFSFVTERALEALAEPRQLEIRPMAFELFPVEAPLPEAAHAAADIDAASPLAQELGIELRWVTFLPRTGKAHEAAAFAAAAGVGRAMRRGIYEAYWLEGRDIGRIDVLLDIAEAVGVDPVDLRIALDIDRARERVLSDRAVAERLGVVAVPTFFIGTGAEATILQGARPLAALDEALAAG